MCIDVSYCAVPKISIPLPPPTEGTFVLDSHPPGISTPGGACHSPPISVYFFQLRWVQPPASPEKIFPLKMLLHYTFMRKIIVSAIQAEVSHLSR